MASSSPCKHPFFIYVHVFYYCVTVSADNISGIRNHKSLLLLLLTLIQSTSLKSQENLKALIWIFSGLKY